MSEQNHWQDKLNIETIPDEISRAIKSCENCICNRCIDNTVNGKQLAPCSGCATCSGTITNCPFDAFREG